MAIVSQAFYQGLKNIRAQSNVAFQTLVAAAHPRYEVSKPDESKIELFLKHLPPHLIDSRGSEHKEYDRVWQILVSQARNESSPLYKTIRHISSELCYNKAYLCVKSVKQESEEAFQTLCLAAHDPYYVKIPSLPILRIINKHIMHISEDLLQHYAELELLEDGWSTLRIQMIQPCHPMAAIHACGYRASPEANFQLVHVDTSYASFLSALSLVIKELKQLQKDKPGIFGEFLQGCIDKKLSMKCAEEICAGKYKSPSLMHYTLEQGWEVPRSMVLSTLQDPLDKVKKSLQSLDDTQLRKIRIEHPLKGQFQGLLQEVYLKVAQLYTHEASAFQVLLQLCQKDNQYKKKITLCESKKVYLLNEWNVWRELWHRHGLFSLSEEIGSTQERVFNSQALKTQNVVFSVFNIKENNTSILMEREEFPGMTLQYPLSMILASGYLDPKAYENPQQFILLDYGPYPSLMAAYKDTLLRLLAIQKESQKFFNNFIAVCLGEASDYDTSEAIALVEKYGLGDAIMPVVSGFSFRGFVLNCTYLDQEGVAHIRSPLPQLVDPWTV